MSLTWAIIFEPDTNVSGGVINQISFHLKYISGVKIPGNVGASEILMSLTWAIIVEPDTNVSEGVINQISFHFKHISAVKIPRNVSASEIDGPGEPEFIVLQNEPVISISFVELCLRLYVYCDINWRWARGH